MSTLKVRGIRHDLATTDSISIASTNDVTFNNDVFVTGDFTSVGIDDNAAATAMTIDSSGNVGIGTSSPTGSWSGTKLAINTGDINFQRTDGPQNIIWGATASYSYISGNASSNVIAFGTANTERMRIDSSGNLLVATTSPLYNTTGSGSGFDFNANGYLSIKRNATSTATQIAFHNPNGLVGQIVTTNSATAYSTSSDYRLKTDVQPMTGATERLKALKPVNFEWIADGTRVDGFLAHEAQEVVPEAVTGTKDAMRTEEYEVTPAVLDDDGNVVTEAVMGTREVPDYQGIDQSKLVPLLVAAMQEQQSTIETLQSTIDSMEARLTALEGVS